MDEPTLYAVTIADECFCRKSFGHVIGVLKMGLDLDNVNITVSHVVPEEVILNVEVLGPRGYFLVRSKKVSPHVVLINVCLEGGINLRIHFNDVECFTQFSLQWQHHTQALRESGLFGMQS